jgi:hypothetical protein
MLERYSPPALEQQREAEQQQADENRSKAVASMGWQPQRSRKYRKGES